MMQNVYILMALAAAEHEFLPIVANEVYALASR